MNISFPEFLNSYLFRSPENGPIPHRMQKSSDTLLDEAVPDKLRANWPWKFSTQVAWLENLFKARHGCRPWLLYFSNHSNMVSGDLMLVNFPLFQGRVIREMWLGTCSLSLFFFPPPYFYYAMTLTKISLKYLLADFLLRDQKKKIRIYKGSCQRKFYLPQNICFHSQREPLD